MGLGGLIAGALGGAAKGYVETSQSELRKQQTLDLQKQTMAMEEEKQLRIDEIRRNRDIADIGKKADAETDASVRNAPKLAQSKVDSRVAELGAAEKAGLPAMEADAAAQVEAAKYKALLKAGVPAAKAAAEAAAFAAGADLRKAQRGEVVQGEIDATTTMAGNQGYLSGKRRIAEATETSSQRASAAATSDANRRAQSEFTRLENARAAAVDYQDAMDRGDDAAAKNARKRGLRFGVDPAGVKRGALKVTEDDMGNKVLVHEDDKGNVTRVDTSKLPAYGETKPQAGSTGGGPKEGDRSKSKSGKDIIYRNGQWEYL